jgi:hypothetical protein
MCISVSQRHKNQVTIAGRCTSFGKRRCAIYPPPGKLPLRARAQGLTWCVRVSYSFDTIFRYPGTVFELPSLRNTTKTRCNQTGVGKPDIEMRFDVFDFSFDMDFFQPYCMVCLNTPYRVTPKNVPKTSTKKVSRWAGGFGISKYTGVPSIFFWGVGKY